MKIIRLFFISTVGANEDAMVACEFDEKDTQK